MMRTDVINLTDYHHNVTSQMAWAIMVHIQYMLFKIIAI